MTSTGQTHPTASHQLVEVPPRQAGLHQVPVTEQHCVGDCPEERGAGEGSQQRDTEVAAGIDGCGDEADDAQNRRDEVDLRRELATRLVSALPSRSIPVISATRCDRRSCSSVWPGHSCFATHDRQDQGERRCRRHGRGADFADPHQAESGPDHARRGSHQQVDATKQPSVSEADLAPTGREPQERQPTDRPLQQHSCSVEADHAGQATSQPIPAVPSVHA